MSAMGGKLPIAPKVARAIIRQVVLSPNYDFLSATTEIRGNWASTIHTPVGNTLKTIAAPTWPIGIHPGILCTKAR